MSDRLQTRPLRRNLILASVSIIALALLFDRLYEYAVIRSNDIEHEQTTRVQEMCYALARDYSQLLMTGRTQELRLSVAARGVRVLIKQLTVMDDGGTVLASTDLLDHGRPIAETNPLFDDGFFRQAAGGNTTVIHITPDGQSVFGYAPVSLPPAPGELRSLRRGLLFVEVDIGRLKAANWQHLFSVENLLRWVSVFLLASLLLGFLLKRQLFRPLSHLEEITSRLGRGDWEARSRLRGTGELARLGDVLNEMRRQIMSERRLLLESEAHLRKARDAADTANQAKSTFLTNMSHELRTPLNAILGFSGMLARDRETTANNQEKLSIINRSGEHLLNMINSVLDLSKIEAGRVELEPVAFDLPLMLKGMAQMIEVRAESAGLRFDLVIDAAIAQCIKADSGKLRQILINLLGNAVTFTSEGMVSLRARTLPIADYPSMVTLQIEVEDNGPGIEAEHLEHIFEPFVQAGQALNDLKGSGLGLAICKSFVEMMGGEISVTSKPDKGSLFRVKLPVALAEAEEVSGIEIARPAVLGLAPNQTSWRIVVAEDNTDNRLLLSSLLIEAGFEIREAENGEQAVALFKQWHPHFIWMDMRMPVLDGYQATTKIRSLPGGDAVKIVAITANVFKEWKDEVMAVGADDFVRKPYKPEEIFDCMARQLGVRYLYQQEVEKTEARKAVTQLTPEMLAGLPADLLAELQNAVRAHDMEQTNAVLDRLSGVNPELLNALRQLVEDMNFRALKSVLGLPKKQNG